MKLDLLLASAGDAAPILPAPLDIATSEGMTRPASTNPPSAQLRHDAADPNDLAQQRWGIVAPEGPAGARLLDALAPLVAARRDAQRGRPVFVRQVPSSMDTETAAAWKKTEYDRLPVAEQPRYLLFLGDLDQVSLDLQQALAHDTFAGRLAFAREADYEAYAAKVLEHARRPAARPRLLFFSAHDRSSATDKGHRLLVQPVAKECQVQHDLGEGGLAGATIDPPIAGLRKEADELLGRAAAPEPTVLFSMGHGLGLPALVWSAEERRAKQGALSLGPGEPLTAADIAGRPFLPGGIWFLVACYGAATPARSAFHHWLLRLRALGKLGAPGPAVLGNLPQPGEKPFVAALPQAALAKPDGPLAVIGHADLAWTSSFMAIEPGGTGHATRFHAIVRALVDGYRAGVAEHELVRFFGDTSVELTRMYDDEARGELGATKGPGWEERKARLWMRRNDLGGYVLLGDPAVALSGARGVEAAVGAGLDERGMEEAVLAVLRGADVHEVAGRCGAAAVEVTRWVEAYREVGRAVLGAIRRERG